MHDLVAPARNDSTSAASAAPSASAPSTPATGHLIERRIRLAAYNAIAPLVSAVSGRPITVLCSITPKPIACLRPRGRMGFATLNPSYGHKHATNKKRSGNSRHALSELAT